MRAYFEGQIFENVVTRAKTLRLHVIPKFIPFREKIACIQKFSAATIIPVGNGRDWCKFHFIRIVARILPKPAAVLCEDRHIA